MFDRFIERLKDVIINPILLNLEENRKNRKITHIRRIVHEGFKDYADHLYVSDDDRIIRDIRISDRNLELLSYRLEANLDIRYPMTLEMKRYSEDYVELKTTENDSPKLVRTVGDLIEHLNQII